jgi:hypothetical protein
MAENIILKTTAKAVPMIKTFFRIAGSNCDAAIPMINALSADNTRSIKIIWMVIRNSSEKKSINDVLI